MKLQIKIAIRSYRLNMEYLTGYSYRYENSVLTLTRYNVDPSSIASVLDTVNSRIDYHNTDFDSNERDQLVSVVCTAN